MRAHEAPEVTPSGAPAQPPFAVRMAWFGVVSIPIVAGFFMPGAVWLSFWWVAPLAGAFGPRIWSGTSRRSAALLSLGVALLVWFPTSANTIDLVLPLCGTDTIGIVVPAVAATAVYAAIGALAVRRGQPRLWLAAAAAFALTHGIATFAVMSTGTAAPVTC